MSNDVPIAAEAVGEPAKPAAEKTHALAIVLAAVIGYGVWLTPISLKNADVLSYISAKQKDLEDHPIAAPAPGAAEWSAAVRAEKNFNTPITAAMTFGVWGALTAIGSLAFLWGTAGIRHRGWGMWVLGAVLLTILGAAVGWGAESVFIMTKNWQVEKNPLSAEVRFMIGEAALWAGLGAVVAVFSTMVYGRPAPAWKALPSMVLISMLGGIVAACLVAAVTMDAEYLSPLSKLRELGAILGLGSAILCAGWTWKATQHA